MAVKRRVKSGTWWGGAWGRRGRGKMVQGAGGGEGGGKGALPAPYLASAWSAHSNPAWGQRSPEPLLPLPPASSESHNLNYG